MAKIQRNAAAFTMLLIAVGLTASPMPRAQVGPRPPVNVTRPPNTPAASCNNGPAPALLPTVKHSLYVELAWIAVNGAKEYRITRADTTLKQSPLALTPPGFTGQGYTTGSPTATVYDFIDAAPDPRDTYLYSLSAIQPNGCYGTVSFSSGPFQTPNPDRAHAVRTSPTKANLIWHGMWGAVMYRIDGPGLPNTGLMLRAGGYTPGHAPTTGPTDPPLSTMYNPSESWWNYDYVFPVANLGAGEYDYTVVAMYPGNFADYTRKTAVVIPAIPQCLINNWSPTSGVAGTVVTITGRGFSFLGNATFTYDTNPSRPFSVSRKVLNDATMTIDTSALVLPAGSSPANGGFSLKGPVNGCGVRYTVLPPAPPPPSPVVVPWVSSIFLQNAQTLLKTSGFVLGSVTGPTDAAAFVLSQTPKAGAKAAPGSAISLTTVDLGSSGINQVILYNNTEDKHSVNVWLYDGTTQQMSGGEAVAADATTTVSLSSAHIYTVFAVDPAICGQNNALNVDCDRWQQSFVGDPNGSPVMTSIN